MDDFFPRKWHITGNLYFWPPKLQPMKLFRSLLLTGIIATFIISCQKEVSEEVGNPPIDPVDSNSVLLKKYIRIDTTLSAPGDTIFTATYLYDAAKRCTTIMYKYFDHPFADEDEGTATETITYNGSDTLMSSRTIRVNNADGTTFTNSAFFTYDNIGRLVKDSMNYDLSRTVFMHRYEGNIVHSVSKFSNAPGDTVFYSRHHLQKVNGNIISEKDTAWDATTGWPYSEYTITAFTGQYDNHPNPLFKMSAPWPVMFEAEHYFQTEFSSQQKNNFTFNSISWGDSEDFSYQYSYLANGYPSIARIHYVQVGTHDEYWKAIYQYY